MGLPHTDPPSIFFFFFSLSSLTPSLSLSLSMSYGFLRKQHPASFLLPIRAFLPPFITLLPYSPPFFLRFSFFSLHHSIRICSPYPVPTYLPSSLPTYTYYSPPSIIHPLCPLFSFAHSLPHLLPTFLPSSSPSSLPCVP